VTTKQPTITAKKLECKNRKMNIIDTYELSKGCSGTIGYSTP